MRLFIAVNFDDITKERLLAVQDKLKVQCLKGVFAKPENLHLTLVFIGETASNLVPVIASVVTQANTIYSETSGTFSINFNHIGCFKRGGKELWWIGPGANNENKTSLAALIKIRQQICSGLAASNIPFDQRPFRAHITLGREIKTSAPINVPEENISIPVKRISLMKSERIKGTLVYTEI